MFDTLSDRFEGIFKRLRGKGRLTAADVDEVLKEIRTALLEADVNVALEPQCSDERQRLPVTVWHAGDQPLAARAAAIVTDHFRRDRGLVNEHQARCLERRLLSFQRSARSRNIRPILLGGVQSFF